jgi:predicted GNAT family acetyltransferase
MEIRRFGDVAAFYRHTEAFYAAHEAENNLPLGILTSRIAQPNRVEPDIYLAVAEHLGEIVAAALRTPPFNLVLSRIPNTELRASASELLARDARAVYGTLRGVLGPAAEARAFAEQWQRLADGTYHLGMRQRIYQLDAVSPPREVPGTMRRAAEADRDLLLRWLEAFSREAHPDGVHQDAAQMVDTALSSPARDLFLWEAGGEPVTLVGRSGDTPHGARVGPVYTPPEHRRRGYASACTAAVSQALLDAGRSFCFLFTDLANPTSNHIYQAIGYRPVCDVDEYRFGLDV